MPTSTPPTIAQPTEEELRAVPVFPLPNCVLFPGAALPLHFFEPRYRAMAEDCDRLGLKFLALAQLRPGWPRDYDGNPPICNVAGLGKIRDLHGASDGTFQLIVDGVARVRLDELDAPDRIYRVAKATPLVEIKEPPPRQADVHALLSCASVVVGAVRKQHPEFEVGVDASDSPSMIADAVADRLLPDAMVRQLALETLDVNKRLELVTEAVGELMAMVARSASGRYGLAD